MGGHTSYYLNPKLAVVADARGMFGNAHALINNHVWRLYAADQRVHVHGRRKLPVLCTEKTAISVQGLGGVGWGIFSGGSKGIPSTTLGIWPDGFRPAFSVGVSADYNFYPNLAFRVTPTYVGTTFGGSCKTISA